MSKSGPETAWGKLVRVALQRQVPLAVVHKMHGDEMVEKGIPDLIGSVGDMFLGWELKVKPNPPDEDQIGFLRRYRSRLAGILYLLPAKSAADDDLAFFVRGLDMEERWSYRSSVQTPHYKVSWETIPNSQGKLVRIPRVDKLIQLLRGIE